MKTDIQTDRLKNYLRHGGSHQVVEQAIDASKRSGFWDDFRDKSTKRISRATALGK